MAEKSKNLEKSVFYPKEIMQSSLPTVFSSNLIEKKIQVFYVEKTTDDKK